MEAPALRVVVCDDVPELRALVRHGLEEDGDLVVVGEAGDVPELVAVLDRHPADAVLLDLSMPGMDGLQAIPLLAERAPTTAIVVFSGFAADRVAAIALELGADRYLEKGTDLAIVRATIRDVSARRHGSAPAA
jgi:DNA-binding NarL/FixJ family response regulator